MQKECLRVGEKDFAKHFKPVQRLIFEVKDGESDTDEIKEAEETRREHVHFRNREGTLEILERHIYAKEIDTGVGCGPLDMDGLIKRKKEINPQ